MDKATKKLKEIEIKNNIRLNSIIFTFWILFLGFIGVVGLIVKGILNQELDFIILGFIILVGVCILFKIIHGFIFKRFLKAAKKEYKGILKI